MPQVAVGKFTEGVWEQVLRDVSDVELREAVVWYLRDETERKWPMPAQIVEYVKKYRNWRNKVVIDDIECRRCNGLGLVPTNNYRGLGVFGFTTCTCSYGRSKAIWLDEERKRGRAWSGAEELAKAQSAVDEPTEMQEEIPF